MGWVKDVRDFYNQLSCYCQPSATEGFGIEVLEAMAHGRPVVCSVGAGAADIVPSDYRVFPSRDVDKLAEVIDRAYTRFLHDESNIHPWQDVARVHTWTKIKQRYVELWESLLEERA
jgi:glycosyltransferase involved in cell wall biosynthesis